MNFLQEWELFWVVGAVGDNVIDNIRDAFVIEVNQDLQRNGRDKGVVQLENLHKIKKGVSLSNRDLIFVF